jgi:YesN/AraC family two-component response regulator
MPRILIVDDETTVSMGLEELLKSIGHEVVGVASSGVEAVEMATIPRLVSGSFFISLDISG